MADITYELSPESTLVVASLKLSKSNRYRQSSMYKMNLEDLFETWNIPQVPKSAKDSVHIIQSGEEGRWDLISYQYYNSVLYWWVICLANNIINPLDVLPAGTAIIVPDIDSVRSLDTSYLLGAR